MDGEKETFAQKLKESESESKEGNQLVELFKNEESERKGRAICSPPSPDGDKKTFA